METKCGLKLIYCLIDIDYFLNVFVIDVIILFNVCDLYCYSLLPAWRPHHRTTAAAVRRRRTTRSIEWYHAPAAASCTTVSRNAWRNTRTGASARVKSRHSRTAWQAFKLPGKNSSNRPPPSLLIAEHWHCVTVTYVNWWVYLHYMVFFIQLCIAVIPLVFNNVHLSNKLQHKPIQVSRVIQCVSLSLLSLSLSLTTHLCSISEHHQA